MATIPYGRQHISEADIQSVVSVLRDDYLTQGPRVEEFESEFARYVGSSHAVAVANGTAALHLSAIALGIQSGDRVITTPITFAASANCVRYCDGEVVFADIDPKTYLLDHTKVERLLEAAPAGFYKGIIPVDFAGRAVDMEQFRKLAKRFNLWLLEDACHAPGGAFISSASERVSCGSNKFSDLTIFSFHPVKHITTGEGGMITTNSADMAQKIRRLRSHGITRDQDCFSSSVAIASGGEESAGWPGWYMEMQDLGYNYRLSDIHCALGVSQLRRAQESVSRRREIARIYHEAFRDLPQIIDNNCSTSRNDHAFHLYVIEVERRLELYNFLKERGIYTQIHYIPCHLMPYYRQFGWKIGDLPCSENYYTRCISLPMFPSMTGAETQFVIDSIKVFYDSV